MSINKETAKRLVAEGLLDEVITDVRQMLLEQIAGTKPEERDMREHYYLLLGAADRLADFIRASASDDAHERARAITQTMMK